MPATYDDELPTDKDWVRFHVPDRDVATARFTDAEVEAVIAQEANKWYAAARLAGIILAERLGATSKSVEGLSISWGDGTESTYRAHIRELREEGARVSWREDGKSAVFRSL